jgi:hypothetical protein
MAAGTGSGDFLAHPTFRDRWIAPLIHFCVSFLFATTSSWADFYGRTMLTIGGNTVEYGFGKLCAVIESWTLQCVYAEVKSFGNNWQFA